MTRAEARAQIIEKANSKIARGKLGGHMLSSKDINQAVAIVRHHKLVDAEVLEAAGFHGKVDHAKR